jgi:hypothetical protein
MLLPRHRVGVTVFTACVLAAACSNSAGHGTPTGATGTGGTKTTGANSGGSTTSAAGGANASTGTAPTSTSTGAAGGATTTSTGAGGGPPDGGPVVAPQPLSPNIVVDQFGYRTGDEKIAVIRSPQTGFDTAMKFTPGAMYALVDAHTSAMIMTGAPMPWNGGATDASSGDKAWWFDFSSVTKAGDYFVLDLGQMVRSDVFTISDVIYRDVLVQAVRMLYYQRDGFAKDAQHAGADWVDAAAHMGKCYLYSDAAKTLNKDLHGGWWDAGDFNKYTNWGAEDVIELLRAYEDNPVAFGDDTNIPESGNGVPDLLDEAKWELDWLVRMQNTDGSVLSVVDEPSAPSPSFGNPPDTSPSKVTTPCFYGPQTTAASLSTAAAFAYASRVLAGVSKVETIYPGFTADLANRAKQAWTWAQANKAVYFYNAQNNVAAGEQEVGAGGIPFKLLESSLYLFELTSDPTYQAVFDANYGSFQLIQSGSSDAYHGAEQEVLLGYTQAKGATPAVVQKILTSFKSASKSGDNLGAITGNKDPYMAYLSSYTWGSNQVKADQGNLLYDLITYNVDPTNGDAARGAERYIHYIHGVNPLQIVYLSTMTDHGAAKSVTRFFHSWYAKGSLWDAFGVSMYGPPPGYLTGGPNPGYTWDGCCPGNCSGNSCGAGQPSPPAGQPNQKSYKDFNDGWPLDTWSVTEPDDGYQAKYIRLLSKFVK